MLSEAATQSILAIGYVGSLISVAGGLVYMAHRRGLSPSHQLLYFWLVFDALIHVFRMFFQLNLSGRPFRMVVHDGTHGQYL